MKTTGARGIRPHELQRLLGKQPAAPLYFCLGEESYAAAQAIDLLRAATVGPDDVFNTQRFEVGAPMSEIVDAAATLPAFAERRLLILTGAEALKADDQELLTTYVNDPSPTTCFVIAAAKADQRRKLFTALLQRATVINCHPLLERELPGWLNGQAAAMGLQLEPDVAHALVEQAGPSLHALRNELEKLLSHAASGPQSTPIRITADALPLLAPHGRDRSVFDFTDAVGERRLAAALTVTRQLLDQGEQPVGLVALLTRHLRRVWYARLALDAGESAADLARRLGVMPRYAETVQRQARGFTPGHLQRALARCLTADSQLKGGRLPKEQVVELLLIEICQGWPNALMADARA